MLPLPTGQEGILPVYTAERIERPAHDRALLRAAQATSLIFHNVPIGSVLMQ